MLERIEDNVYKFEFLGDVHVSVTFNVGDLTPNVEDKFEDLRANPSQEGEADAHQAPSPLLATPTHQNPSQLFLLKMVTAPTFHPVSV